MKKITKQVGTKMKSGTRGFLLMATYLLLAAFSIYSLALFSRGTTFMQAAERNQNRMMAFNMAEAGTDKILAALRVNPENPSYGGTNYQDLSSGKLTGGYIITVTTPNPISAPSVRMIEVTGHSPSNNNQSRAHENRTITTYVEVGGGPIKLFEYAAYGTQKVSIKGSLTTRSYKSSSSIISGSGTKGHLATGSIAPEAFKIDVNRLNVSGDLVVGGNPASVIKQTSDSSSVNVTGTRRTAEPKQFQPPTTNITSLGSLTIPGNTVTSSMRSLCTTVTPTGRCQLQAGTYRFDSLDIGKTGSSIGRLEALGPVKIFVDGDVSINGRVTLMSSAGQTLLTPIPKNFLLYSKGNSVSVSPSSTLYGAIYAPNATINAKSGTYKGALVGKEYNFDGSATLYFDEDLMDEQNGVKENFNGPRVLAWTEGRTMSWGMESAPSQPEQNRTNTYDTAVTANMSR